MNRSPLAHVTSETGESLARLAEIAEVLSRQQPTAVMLGKPAATITPSANPSSINPGGPLLKRPVEAPKVTIESNKRAKTVESEEPHGDVRFREYQAEIWSEKFEDLCEFRRFYGHCHVPHYYQRNAPLAQWVKRQRYQYKLKIDGKRSTLSDERVRLLNKIGFIWNSHDAVWEERWNELLLYKRVMGDCIVPSNYEKNPQLAVWVKRQRRQYKFYCEGKSTSMTPERIAKLEKLGFAWDCRKPKETTKPGAMGKPAPVTFLNPTNVNAMAFLKSVNRAPPAPVIPTAIPSNVVTTLPLKLPKCEFFTFSRKFNA